MIRQYLWSKFLLVASPLLSSIIDYDVWLPEILINVGATGNYSDTVGNIWMKDSDFTENTTMRYSNVSIANTRDENLYQSYRTASHTVLANMNYLIPVRNGEKKIQLMWAELEKANVGQRIFDVMIGTNLTLQNVDVFAIADSAETAITKEIFVNITAGILNISFAPKVDVPFISAIGVYSKSSSTSPPQQGELDGGAMHFSQPKVTIVDPIPKSAEGSISMPQGSLWCAGRPTYWWVGHDNTPETPRCQQLDGNWTAPQIAKLAVYDATNVTDPTVQVDRHDCTLIDMNGDGIMDIVCVVGANKGVGEGYNEIYITQIDGSLKKILYNDLQKYRTMRTRLTTTITAADGGKLVLIATEGTVRPDGRPNEHRMFHLVSNATEEDPVPHFNEVIGPWILPRFGSACLRPFDLNNDGIEDVIMCNRGGPTYFMMQRANLTWTKIGLDKIGVKGRSWNDARVVDVTGDGIPDLIACGPFDLGGRNRDAPFVRVFRGDPSLPLLFDFDSPYYLFRPAPTAEARAVEVLDLNGDGLLDIYVVLMDPKERACAYNLGNSTIPLDTVHDYVLVGTSNASAPFEPVEMLFEHRGCAGKIAKWGERSLMLAEATLNNHGVSLLLEW